MTGRALAARRAAEGLLVGVAGIAAITAVIWSLQSWVPVLALADLYILAILPVAIRWGFGPALAIALASTLTFDFFFTAPLFTFTVTESETVATFVISAATAYAASALAASARRRRREAESLAGEQAALRRVATLVARAAPAEATFAAVAEETGRLLGCDMTALARYDPDGGRTILGAWSGSRAAIPPPVGSRESNSGRHVSTVVRETRRPARIDRSRDRSGVPSTPALAPGVRSAVGAPISVEGRLWGVMIAASLKDQPLPADTEDRLAAFTELVATAVANAEARAALTASRARIVATADATRRRIERDLHDGAQQRLVSLALRLRSAQAAVPPGAGGLSSQLDGVVDELTGVLEEMRTIARGIHPAVLAEGGLRPALRALARRSAVPVRLDVRGERRLPEQIEIAAYYVVSEALTNTAKHTDASVIDVVVENDDGELHLSVHDDGQGGAELDAGSGLVGLKDRAEALGGRFSVRSERGSGTTIDVTLPLEPVGPVPA